MRLRLCVCCWELYALPHSALLSSSGKLYWSDLTVVFFCFFEVMHLIWKNLSCVNFFLISQWNRVTQNISFRIGGVEIVHPSFLKNLSRKNEMLQYLLRLYDTHTCTMNPVHYVLSMLVFLNWCQIYNLYYRCVLGNIAQPDSSSSGGNASLLFSGNPKSHAEHLYSVLNSHTGRNWRQYRTERIEYLNTG